MGASRKSWYLEHLKELLKILLDSERGMKGIHFVSISFFRSRIYGLKRCSRRRRLWVFVIFHDFQPWLSREREKIKIRTLFRWNCLAILNRIDLVRILRVFFRNTIRKLPPPESGYFGPVEWEIACYVGDWNGQWPIPFFFFPPFAFFLAPPPQKKKLGQKTTTVPRIGGFWKKKSLFWFSCRVLYMWTKEAQLVVCFSESGRLSSQLTVPLPSSNCKLLESRSALPQQDNFPDLKKEEGS